MRIISTEQLIQMRKRHEGVALVNVLSADKFSQTRIPGAINIPLDDPTFVDRVEKSIGGKDQKVVVYCGGEQCPKSTNAAEKLEAAGFTDVLDYKGGAEAWQESEIVSTANV